MGKMKNTIPENYVCNHYCEEICMECQYSMETAHYPKRWRPTMQTWYNRVSKKAEEKIREYFKKQEKKKKKVEIPF